MHGGKRDVPNWRLGAMPDDFFYFLANRFQGDAHGLEGLCSNALTLMDKSEQDVLSADVIVVKAARFFLRQDDHATCTISKPLEHGCTSFS